MLGLPLLSSSPIAEATLPPASASELLGSYTRRGACCLRIPWPAYEFEAKYDLMTILPPPKKSMATVIISMATIRETNSPWPISELHLAGRIFIRCVSTKFGEQIGDKLRRDRRQILRKRLRRRLSSACQAWATATN